MSAAEARPGCKRRGGRACDVAAAEANYAAAQRRADSGAARHRQRTSSGGAATLAVLERRLDKTMVRVPADGIVTVRPRSSQA
jgi:HlyD family secretion protein